MTAFVFDTNIVSFLVEHDSTVQSKMNERLQPEDIVFGCPMVWYEILRGLRAKDARRKTGCFRSLFASFEWREFERADWSLAADLWSKRRALGRPISDADLLIAVFAINRNAILVTDNTKDFSGLDVHLENWR